MAAPLGNKNKLALKTSELRRDAFAAYCAHLAKGKVAQSFVYKNGEYSAIWSTIETYIKEYPEDCPKSLIEIAKAEGYAHWEEVCDGSAKGENEANTPSLQMVMRNKFRWDRPEVSTEALQSLAALADCLSKGRDEYIVNQSIS